MSTSTALPLTAIAPLSIVELRRALAIRDLTDPSQGPHAMQLLLDEIHAALPAPIEVHRASPIVSVADNYDRLGYPPGGAARDARYTRYVCDVALLRTQTSAMIPPLLQRALPAALVTCLDDALWAQDWAAEAADAVDGIVRRIQREWPTGRTPGVVATGGLAQTIAVWPARPAGRPSQKTPGSLLSSTTTVRARIESSRSHDHA